jgi:hypothetical protein
MRLAARIATALAVLGLAVPALACEGMKSSTASAPKTKAAVAKAEKKSDAKSDAKKVN